MILELWACAYTSAPNTMRPPLPFDVYKTSPSPSTNRHQHPHLSQSASLFNNNKRDSPAIATLCTSTTPHTISAMSATTPTNQAPAATTPTSPTDDGFTLVKAAPKKPAAKVANTGAPVKDTSDDVREWSSTHRRALFVGAKLPIYIGDSILEKFVTKVVNGKEETSLVALTITETMLKTTTTYADQFIKGNKVVLPAGTNKVGVIHLVDYFHYVAGTKATTASRMSTDLEMGPALAVLSAVNTLGSELYVDNVFKACEAIYCAGIPSYADCRAVAVFDDEFPRFFKIVVDCLATLVRDGTVPFPEAFNESSCAPRRASRLPSTLSTSSTPRTSSSRRTHPSALLLRLSALRPRPSVLLATRLGRLA